MKLISFSVRNFRSITDAYKVPIEDLTILIGKNNEGKSNILNALTIAMNEIIRYSDNIQESRRNRIRRYRNDRNNNYYFWIRDFPIQLQEQNRNTQTVFLLRFLLDDTEIEEFKQEIKSTVNGLIPIEIRAGRDDIVTIKVAKRGKGSKALNSKSKKITDFIAKKISMNYIPAVRSEREVQDEILKIINSELNSLWKDIEYKKALEVVYNMESKIFNKLSERIKIPLIEFIPNIKDVKIESEANDSYRRRLHDFDIIIDDGTATSIDFKGDGIKSLVTLALLKDRYDSDGASIIAIEEPESHLHPAAIHQLNKVIKTLKDSNQVILTTHNPLFANRDNLKSNIIVDSGKAIPAKKISEIRDVLGIKASDNLMNANYVLVVEGNEDKIALEGILRFYSEKLKKSIRTNMLIIDEIGGSGNLTYKLSLLNNYLCKYHVLLDNDSSGKNSCEKAINENLLSVKDVTLTTCNGFVESEFEDCLDINLYKDEIFKIYGVNLATSSFRGSKKWSDRLKNCFLTHGKPFNESIECEIKKTVANLAKEKPDKAISQHHKNSITALISALEMLIE